jgi:hypothetical protein
MLKSEGAVIFFWLSMFLINSQENNLISSQLASIVLENRYFISNSELLNYGQSWLNNFKIVLSQPENKKHDYCKSREEIELMRESA